MSTHRAAWIVGVVLLAVLSPRGAPAQNAPVTIGPMTLAVPAAWTPVPNAVSGLVQYNVPTRSASGQAVVSLTAAPHGGATLAAGHQALWANLVRNTGTPQEQRSGQSGRFVWSEMRVVDARNAQQWHRMYSTQEGSVHVLVSIAADAAAAFASTLAAVEPMLAGARFGAPATAAAAPVAAPAATSVGSVPIVEAHVHVDIRAVTATSNVLTDHILFFGNGIVAREGVITGPRECYALYDVRQLARLPFNYGRWREDKGAGIVQIQWQEGPPWTLKREAGRLSLGGKRLLVLRPLDGLRLDGVYEYRPVGSPPSSIELRPDGRFEAVNLAERMGCPTQARPGALAGAGQYEVRAWTLILRFAGGQVTPLPLHVEAGEDLRQVQRFGLNGHEFVRRR
ncbi:MAG TPA: hypothetical protein VHP37_17470 [Burkholderiales bacterium]|nr:hypothetical protein [Burkholderiales bacterium]